MGNERYKRNDGVSKGHWKGNERKEEREEINTRERVLEKQGRCVKYLYYLQQQRIKKLDGGCHILLQDYTQNILDEELTKQYYLHLTFNRWKYIQFLLNNKTSFRFQISFEVLSTQLILPTFYDG